MVCVQFPSKTVDNKAVKPKKYFNSSPNSKKDNGLELNFHPKQLTTKLSNLENTLT